MYVAFQIDSRLHRRFIKNVKSRRAVMRLTQAEIAAKIRISQLAYAQIECGRNTPTLEIVERVAKALRATPLQLLDANELVTVS